MRSERKCVAVGACRARLPTKKADAPAPSLHCRPCAAEPALRLDSTLFSCCCCSSSSSSCSSRSSCRRSCGQSYNNFCHSLSRHCRAYLVSLSPCPSPSSLLALFLLAVSVSLLLECILIRLSIFWADFPLSPLLLSEFGNFRKASKSFNFSL